jgi:hypothetical protein
MEMDLLIKERLSIKRIVYVTETPIVHSFL